APGRAPAWRRPRRRARMEDLAVDAPRVGAGVDERRAQLLDHRERPAEEPLVEVAPAQHRREEEAQPRRVDAPAVQLDVGRLAREDEVEREPAGVEVLEVEQLLEEHRRGDGAVAVEEREGARWLDLERGGGDREDGRDPGAR